MSRIKTSAIYLFTVFILLLAQPAVAGDIGTQDYDAALAEKLGADDYGMRPYIFVTLLTGPTEITDADKRNELFRGHFANMGRLAEEGKLVLAGPFMEADPKRGLFIFDVSTVAEAEALVETDPAIAAGIFTAEYTRYYGSAALKMVNEIHSTIQKSAIE
ncbi:MAG: YciI family protein [Aquisalinus sp.]|nr:YciI family protein [Aquisalinus sp.]